MTAPRCQAVSAFNYLFWTAPFTVGVRAPAMVIVA
jgi:hypothetical protein